jgi:hypothetical protein
MRTRFFLLTGVLLLLLGRSAAAGLDPRALDILGLRLGMTRPAVLALLAVQGVAPAWIQEQPGPCGTDPAVRCLAQLTAPTRDGILQIRFVAPRGPGSEMIWSIAYTLAGRGAGEPEMIRAAVFERFGPPTIRDPPVWCANAGTAGCSPSDQPQLIYREGPGTSSTLTLSDPAAFHPAP